MNVSITKEDTQRLKSRLLPVEEWSEAPKHIQLFVETLGGNVGLSYDVLFGWCVVRDGAVVYVQKDIDLS